jgi:hypothetical protein
MSSIGLLPNYYINCPKAHIVAILNYAYNIAINEMKIGIDIQLQCDRESYDQFLNVVENSKQFFEKDYFDWKSQQAVTNQEDLERRQQQARSQLTPDELAWQNDLEEIQFVMLVVLVASWIAYWYFSVHL